MSSLSLLPSFRRQQLLIEFASLNHHCPEGIYLTLNPSDPASWSGVYFVREGPYSSAVLHFEILFPSGYPQSPPLVIFATEIFHPLLVPLTTYAFSSAADPSATYSASETERLPPGSFSLKHGFPDWVSAQDHGRASISSASVRSDMSLARDSPTSGADARDQDEALPSKNEQAEQSPFIKLLRYMKAAFEEPTLLDEVSLEAAGNSSAWHAWRSYRGLPKQTMRSVSPIGNNAGPRGGSSRNPADWNWDGLWEARVRNGIDESIDDGLLFGSKNMRSPALSSGPLRFTKFDDDKLENIQTDMIRFCGFEATAAKQ